ncbi:hypothetical protein F2P79_009745 [Pimephales promelas]|nr:hypothetical protein F2P79_009745 [Pimephales promelas]
MKMDFVESAISNRLLIMCLWNAAICRKASSLPESQKKKKKKKKKNERTILHVDCDSKCGSERTARGSTCSSVAQRFGAESCIRESPALKVEMFCDTARSHIDNFRFFKQRISSKHGDQKPNG